jgi:hypothetical protein
MQGRILLTGLIVAIASGCTGMDCSNGPRTFEVPSSECVRGYCVTGTKMVTFCANSEPQTPEQVVLNNREF